MSLALNVENVTKEYAFRNRLFGPKQTFNAVKGLSFSVEQGETVAFLGANGAGKSTTIKMLSGILTPTTGSCHILGFPAGSKEANSRLGLVFGTRSQLWMHITVRQSLDLIAEIYHVRGPEKLARIKELSALFEVEPLLGKRARSLSLGERMRCEIVAALVHRPSVLLADEPTIGLDVVAKSTLRELLLRWQNDNGTTLLLTSHDISDVEALCKRCVLIDHGRKQFDGPLEQLKGDLATVRRIHVTLAHKNLPPLASNGLLKSTQAQEGFLHTYEVQFGKGQNPQLPDFMAQVFAHYGNALLDLRIEDIGLEEVLQDMLARKKLAIEITDAPVMALSQAPRGGGQPS